MRTRLFIRQNGFRRVSCMGAFPRRRESQEQRKKASRLQKIKLNDKKENYKLIS